MLDAARDEQELEQLALDLQRAARMITRGLQNSDDRHEIREAFQMWFTIVSLVAPAPDAEAAEAVAASVAAVTA